jgi:hypothetical protein
MTTRLTVSSLAAPITIKVNTTFAAPLKANAGGPFVIAPGLTSKNVLATVNLKSIGDLAAAKTTLVLPGASTDYIFKTASGAVTISTKVGTKTVTIASLDLTKVAIDTPLVKFTDLTAKFQAATTKLQAALVVIDTPAVPTLLKDTGISAIDGITNDGTLNVSAKTVGGIISYSIDGGKTYATGALPEGVYAAGKISVVEKATNGSISKASSNAVAITVDKTAPAAATKIALDTDTGIATDNITSDGTINITGTLETGARWEFSVNGGTTFTTLAANATSFVVPESATAYAADQIQVRQVDLAGNSSAVTKLATALTVDETAAVPSIALATDTGTAGDGITTIETVNVTGLEAGAKWQYTIGGDYIDGTGTSFTLPTGFTYDAGQINVRQTDIAGNESDADGKFGTNSKDWTIVSPNVAINSTNLTATGTASADIYAIASGSYAATINSFAAGDKLQIFQGASVTVKADANLTDGIKDISITDLSAGTTATITLKDLTPAQDNGLFNLSSFDIFGADTVKIGNAITAPATTTNISGSVLTGTGTDGVDTFNVASGTYPATIANFKPGDKLKFFTGASITVNPDTNSDDGYQQISATDPSSGATAIITLTGLTQAQDDGAFNVSGFNNVFGAGTIA